MFFIRQTVIFLFFSSLFIRLGLCSKRFDIIAIMSVENLHYVGRLTDVEEGVIKCIQCQSPLMQFSLDIIDDYNVGFFRH